MLNNFQYSLIILLIGLIGPTKAFSETAAFDFGVVTSLGEMHAKIRATFAMSMDRALVRTMLVDGADATPHRHPEWPNTEKYVFDINLCGIYIWRWNISADYDGNSRLTQIYINGEPVHPEGTKLRDPMANPVPGAEQSISKAQKPRPEAVRGEKSLGYVLLDLDNATNRAQDEFVIGAGPTRADPKNLGKVYTYNSVERWRSIFDQEPAKTIAPFNGPCT